MALSISEVNFFIAPDGPDRFNAIFMGHSPSTTLKGFYGSYRLEKIRNK